MPLDPLISLGIPKPEKAKLRALEATYLELAKKIDHAYAEDMPERAEDMEAAADKIVDQISHLIDDLEDRHPDEDTEAGLEELLANAWAEKDKFLTQDDFIENLRDNVWTQGAKTGSAMHQDVTDAELLAAAKDAYERRLSIQRKLKHAPSDELARARKWVEKIKKEKASRTGANKVESTRHHMEDENMVAENSATQTAMAELQADPDFRAVTPREQNFLVNFLGSVSGDHFADGANFQADIKSYGYKNMTRLTLLFRSHYETFLKALSPEDKAETPEDHSEIPNAGSEPQQLQDVITRSKQSWEVGAVVKVGFLTLRVEEIVPTPGDYAPDEYILVSLDGRKRYSFVPHVGLNRIDM